MILFEEILQQDSLGRATAQLKEITNIVDNPPIPIDFKKKYAETINRLLTISLDDVETVDAIQQSSDFIRSHFKGGRIEIWRLLNAFKKEDLRLDNPGYAWTFNKGSLQHIKFAIANKNKPNSFVYHATCSMDEVNWKVTLLRFLQYSYSAVFGGDLANNCEMEIRVKTGVKLKDITLEPYEG